MSAHRKTRKVVPVAAALTLMALAAGGGYAFAQSRGTPAASLSDSVNLSAQQGAAGSHQVTIYACLGGGTISRVKAGSAPHCGRGSSVIHWAAQSGKSTTPAAPASPSATASPSAPASSAPASSAPASSPPTAVASTPAATSSTPAAAVQDASCTTSSNSGSCGPYSYADISGSATGGGNETSVIQNVWNPTNGASQTLKVDTPGHWSVTANLPASNKAVVSYPDTQQIYTTHSNQPNPLSGYSSITSSYAETSPATSGDDYEAAYDIWANAGSQEIMIWVDNHGQRPSGNDIASATIDGVGYQVWSNGGVGADSTPISLVMDKPQTSGTVNVLGDLKWLESSGYMKSGSGINQIDFGWELCSTGGTAQTFTLSQYSIKATCTSGSSCTQ
jgi:hypothetical protein